MTVETTRDELSVHLERALLVSVALPDRPWLGDDPLEVSEYFSLPNLCSRCFGMVK